METHLTLKVLEHHWVDLLRSDAVTDVQLARVHVQETHTDNRCTLRIEGGISPPPVGMASVEVDVQHFAMIVLRDPAGEAFCKIRYEWIGGHRAKLTFFCEREIKVLRDDAKANHYTAAAAAGGWRQR